MNNLSVRVTDAPFCAKGDGASNDREAIQNAVDFVYSNGGGTVVLDGGRTFLTTGIVIKSNVTLFFEDGAVLYQSPACEGYVKPVGDGYEPYTPIIGHNFSETIKWSHTWYRNYPFIFAPEGAHDFAIKGNGTVKMTEGDDTTKVVRICPIGFYRASNFEISDITITNYHGYAMMPFTSDHGLIKNVKISKWSFGNGDGICLMNCQHIRITGCWMYTGDDSVYIFSSYRDPRRSEWWNSDEPQASTDIEIDHNDLKSHRCKAFGMILWGIDCPDLEKVEVRNVYVHDNRFETMGNWNYNPYTTKTEPHPVTNVRFENNKIEAIEENFFETQISDMNCFRSMRTMRNTEFKDGRVFWSMSGNVSFDRSECFAEIKNGALYQGLYIEAGKPCLFRADVNTAGENCRLFVKNLDTQELVAEKDITCAEAAELEFTVPADGNYHVGIEGSARVCRVEFAGNRDGAFGYEKVTKEDGKIIYHYNLEDRPRRNQLKMYWLPDTPIKELELPEGYSFSHFDPAKDIHDWHDCILKGLCDGITDEQAYQNEIINFHDIVPENDIWFLDYNGKHVATATGFVYSESNMGDMHMVGVHRDYRGRGLAKYLSYIVLKSLKERNVKFVSLTSSEGRPFALKSYISAGFLPVEYAEGMQERWEKFMYQYNIDELAMLNEDGTFYKMIQKRK